jgi:Phosphodiester glycosidase
MVVTPTEEAEIASLEQGRAQAPPHFGFSGSIRICNVQAYANDGYADLAPLAPPEDSAFVSNAARPSAGGGNIKVLIRSRWIAGLALLMCLAAIAAGAAWIIGPQPLQPIEIFSGVSFRSDILPVTEEGGGRVDVVIADLRTPGLQLYVTPLDPAALAKGFRYRLRWISEVTRTEQLSVVVNATMFASQSSFWFPLPGDLANSAFGTLVADHVVADVQRNSDLLWFDDQLQSHLRPWDASLRPRDLATAKWAIGGQIILRDGEVANPDGLDRRSNSRTAAAIDRQHHLFLAVAEDLSPRRFSERLAELGATDGILLDGGSSSAMAIGGKPRGATAGVVYGGWRPVATYFGIRAPRARQGQ